MKYVTRNNELMDSWIFCVLYFISYLIIVSIVIYISKNKCTWCHHIIIVIAKTSISYISFDLKSGRIKNIPYYPYAHIILRKIQISKIFSGSLFN